ncbi:hypothetical protein [Rudaeicoccus suwonensis]|uniref:Uncharacterized protein n=1 Tax=Rudaeicoccus suwonensis TaxID=657409 RepID=A0A561E341_9MICO|nr:hypothetical protein [Rudaeicoccus suwonensis]TWE10035.1 hypothetical protein BKA23_2383 [Rudaeicoccus suwonensis]
MTQQGSQLSRRKIAKGAAWTIPVVALGAAAPASAASCATRTCPVAIGFGALSGTPVNNVYPSATTWGPQTATAIFTGTTRLPGFRATDPLGSNGAGPWWGVGAESALGGTVSVSLDSPVTLVAGCSYTLSLNASTYQGQAQTSLAANVGAQTVYTLTPPTTGTPGNGISNLAQTSAVFTVPTTTTYSVGLTITLAAAGTGSNNDIYVSNLLINCA